MSANTAEPEGYSWEQNAERSWEDLDEDESGRLRSAGDVEEASAVVLSAEPLHCGVGFATRCVRCSVEHRLRASAVCAAAPVYCLRFNSNLEASA